MKFILLAVATCLFTIAGNSQTRFGIFAGPQATSASYHITGKTQDTKFKPGFQAGICFRAPFDSRLFFYPSVFYSMKGYKVNYSLYQYPPDANAKDNNTTFHCVELAGMLQYDFSDQPDHAFLRVGPSLDFQLFGHEKFNLIGGGTVDRKIPFDFDKYGHYSANMLAHVGYETGSGLMIFAQATIGITNISNVDEGPKIRHRAYGISIGKYLR